MSKHITLEDINTWILKYGELDAPKYSMPHINVTGVLYRGNNNNLYDIISLPDNVDYTIYYNNRPVETLFLPVDHTGESVTFRVVTSSSYPYVNSDVKISVGVETKHLESLEDLNKYNYGYIDSLIGVNGTISNDISISLVDDAVFSDCNLTFDANVSISGDLTINNSFITNNSRLLFEGVVFDVSDTGVKYLIVNNSNLTIRNSTISSTLPFILNKDSLVFEGNTISVLSESVPFLYSNNLDMSIIGNTVEFSSLVDYLDFGVCFIRCNDLNIDKLLIDNTFTYSNVKVTLEETDYLLNGNGVCYCKLDDDTVFIKDLEVI